MSEQDKGISISGPTYDTPKSGDQVDLTWSGRSASVAAGESSQGDDAATDGIQRIPAQIPPQESPTVAVARERLVEAIGREAVFLADQRAGQASEGLEALARAFALATGSAPAHVGNGAGSATAGTARVSSFADWAASA
nr:hypothetical protein OG409_34500 [Streptomyces sp. NBC_00974]